MIPQPSSKTDRYYTLIASCPDQVGIVAKVAGLIAEHHGWILETHHFADADSGRYFMRLEVKADSLPFGVNEFRRLFRSVADSLHMDWRITDSAVRKRLILMVSTQEHCLYDLLSRWQAGELKVDIPCIISNHERFRSLVEWHGIRYQHIPVTAETRQSAFDEIGEIVERERVDAIVLARYMQIVPPALCDAYPGRIINIHHSFLPSFVGARPYHQAHVRGVKLIGATCHYVTSELDAGPIIEQDTLRADHSESVEDLVRSGKDVEKAVLARGVRYHVEDRVLLNGLRTVVFK